MFLFVVKYLKVMGRVSCTRRTIWNSNNVFMFRSSSNCTYWMMPHDANFGMWTGWTKRWDTHHLFLIWIIFPKTHQQLLSCKTINRLKTHNSCLKVVMLMMSYMWCVWDTLMKFHPPEIKHLVHVNPPCHLMIAITINNMIADSLY